MRPSGPGLLFVGSCFFLNYSVSLFVIDMFMFLFLPGSALGDCILFGNCPFLLCCQLY